MTIKHLYIGGGHVYGFSFFGLLKQTNINKIWSLNNIKSIHGISAGSIIGTIISLNLEWDVIENYLINRPWNEIFDLNINSIFNSFQNCGIFSKNEFVMIFESLFSAKDISCDITMLDFYKLTGIEHYYIVSKINIITNKIEYLTISYKNYPNWKLLDVMYMSCSLPILFQPLFIDNEVYLDGMFAFKNDVINEISHNNNESLTIDDILLITINNRYINPLVKTSSLFDYLLYIILILIKQIEDVYNIDIEHPNNYKIKKESFNLEIFYLTFTNKEERIRLINLGKNTFNK